MSKFSSDLNIPCQFLQNDVNQNLTFWVRLKFICREIVGTPFIVDSLDALLWLVSNDKAQREQALYYIYFLVYLWMLSYVLVYSSSFLFGRKTVVEPLSNKVFSLPLLKALLCPNMTSRQCFSILSAHRSKNKRKSTILPFPQTYHFYLFIYFKKLKPQIRWNSDVPRIFIVKNKCCHLFAFVSVFTHFDAYGVIVTSHGNCWCLFWLIWIEETKL